MAGNSAYLSHYITDLYTINSARANLREYRKKIAILKRAGIISRRIDARSHLPTRYTIDLINKFPDVIAGRARAVRVPSRAIADLWLRNHGDRVIIPISPGDRARYSAAAARGSPYAHAILVTRGRPIPTVPSRQQIYYPDKNPQFGIAPISPQQVYIIENRGGGVTASKTFMSLSELENFISRYDPENEADRRRWKKQGRKLFVDARQYVSIGRL